MVLLRRMHRMLKAGEVVPPPRKVGMGGGIGWLESEISAVIEGAELVTSPKVVAPGSRRGRPRKIHLTTFAGDCVDEQPGLEPGRQYANGKAISFACNVLLGFRVQIGYKFVREFHD